VDAEEWREWGRGAPERAIRYFRTDKPARVRDECDFCARFADLHEVQLKGETRFICLHCMPPLG